MMPTKQEMYENSKKIEDIHQDVKQASNQLSEMFFKLKSKVGDIVHEKNWNKVKSQSYQLADLSELFSTEAMSNQDLRLPSINRRWLNHDQPRWVKQPARALILKPKEVQGSSKSFLRSEKSLSRLDKIEKMVDRMK